MARFPEGNAIVYCREAFGTTNGKTAHGLVRRSERYRVISVIDPRLSGKDAGEVLDGRNRGIPIERDVAHAVEHARENGHPATHLVIGLAPDGGRLPDWARADVMEAIRRGLHVDSGLHDFLSDDPRMAWMASKYGVVLRDVRKPPSRNRLHFFTDKIREVTAFRVAVLGTDSAVGKRTTAWLLVDGLRQAGLATELIGTGQTSWMQGARYSIVLDSLVSDFVSGEIEHVIWRAWHEGKAQALVLEGQGSLLNPAYPGGFELLAAGRPHVVVLQVAPKRQTYDGFPSCPMDPVEKQVQAVELISGKPVVALTLNHENMTAEEIPGAKEELHRRTGLPVFDVLVDGVTGLIDVLRPHVTQVVGAESPEALG